MTAIFAATILLLAAFGYLLGRGRALALGGRATAGFRLHSRPQYHGIFVAVWAALPALIVVVLWAILEPSLLRSLISDRLPAELASIPAEQMQVLLGDIRALALGQPISRPTTDAMRAIASEYSGMRTTGLLVVAGVAAALALGGLHLSRRSVAPHFRARNKVEMLITALMIVAASIAILTTIGIILSLLFETYRFFTMVPFLSFLFGLEWSPQIAIRADQVGSSGSFGAIPLIAGTMLISAIAMAVAIPVGLMSAVYLAEYANSRVRNVVKPLLEILAGIPTVVYGFFAALTMAPFIRDTGGLIGLDVASESALAAGLVMGIMIIPFVSSLSDDVINAVPQSMRDGSYALGATKSETVKRVILPAALPGIVGAVLLAVSRAIGETMIVVMAAGLAANLTINPLEAVTTVTVQIATLLVGDQEFDSPKTLAAFALGLALFTITLCLNVIALRVVRKYREQYD
ncbi:phosphate ABC transporter permease subunit PstC [Desertibaculum subflavum]|uniref:phosphate ABC transporter permease subunit PstC n=1 Tax=Desertibaculum subflavum TaxID=2268458 RepID=UPI000E67114B